VYQIHWFRLCRRPRQMVVYNGIYVYIVRSKSQLMLYSTVYCRIVYYGGRIYGHDGGYEEGNLTSRVTRWLGDWSGYIEINCDSISAIYLVKNQVYHVRMKHTTSGFTLFGRLLMRVTLKYKRFTRMRTRRYAYQACFESEVWILQRVTPYPPSCLSSVEFIWMNCGWLDPLGRGT